MTELLTAPASADEDVAAPRHPPVESPLLPPSGATAGQVVGQVRRVGRSPAALGISAESGLRLIVALSWLFWSSRFYVATYQFPGATLLTVAYSLGGLVLLAVALGARTPAVLRRTDAVLMGGALAGLLLWVVSLVHTSSEYGTDEAAFTQGAAQLLLHGHNPYGADLSNYLQVYGVSPSSWTATLAGGYIHDLGYPSLSFLFTVPLLALGVMSQAQIWVNAAFFCLGALLLWRRLPPHLRNIVPLVLALDAYGSAVSGGLIFGLALPFAVLAVAEWDRFGVAGERAMVRLGGPVFLGLACAVRQDLWVLVPFLAVGVAQEARTTGSAPWPRAVRYLGLVATAFLLPNLPFIVWNPVAWVRGVIAPVISGLVPLGQGVIGLSLYLRIGGGNLQLCTLLVGLVVLGLLPATFIWYGRFKPLLPIIPAVALFMSSRSLAQYLLFGSLVAIAAVATINRSPAAAPVPGLLRRRLLVLTTVLAAAAAVTTSVALTVPPPLNLAVTSVHTTGQQGTVDEIEVSVHNVSRHGASPRFVVGGGPYVGLPWFADAARAALPPGASATYRLRAPDVSAMPNTNGGFKVYAFTGSPASVSSSPIVTMGGTFARLMPNTTNRVVPAGENLHLQVQVVDRFGQPVRRGGVAVQLGQAEYTSDGLFAGETTINGGSLGASPAVMVTDPDGLADFTVQAPVALTREVFFQAWIGGGSPQGYSRQIAVWFG